MKINQSISMIGIYVKIQRTEKYTQPGDLVRFAVVNNLQIYHNPESSHKKTKKSSNFNLTKFNKIENLGLEDHVQKFHTNQFHLRVFMALGG